MPYIRRQQRDFARRVPTSPGELNFAITDLLSKYLHLKDQGYQTINDIMGALEGAKMEFYRRVVAPYEDNKKARNGDVY